MSADKARVLSRVTEILNLCTAGEFTSTLSPRNKTRNEDAIEAFVDEAGLKILKAIAERPNEFRHQFLEDHTITASGDLLPPHLGPVSKVLIEPYSGGDQVEGQQKDYRKVESFRANPQDVYDAIPHDAEGSSLSGYYDVWEDRFYFTGLEAEVSLARLPVRADNATLIPEIMENTWIKLGVGEAGKVGTGAYETGMIQAYAQRGEQDLQSFMSGERNFKEVDEPDTTKAAHVG